MPYAGNVGRYGYATPRGIIEAERRREEEKWKREEEERRKKKEEEERRKEKEEEERRKKEEETNKEKRNQEKDEEARVCRPKMEDLIKAKTILFKYSIISSWEDEDLPKIRGRYKKWMLKNHTDKGGKMEACQEINSSMDVFMIFHEK